LQGPKLLSDDGNGKRSIAVSHLTSALLSPSSNLLYDRRILHRLSFESTAFDCSRRRYFPTRRSLFHLGIAAPAEIRQSRHPLRRQLCVPIHPFLLSCLHFARQYSTPLAFPSSSRFHFREARCAFVVAAEHERKFPLFTNPANSLIHECVNNPKTLFDSLSFRIRISLHLLQAIFTTVSTKVSAQAQF